MFTATNCPIMMEKESKILPGGYNGDDQAFDLKNLS
jgi:hypothetical protein